MELKHRLDPKWVFIGLYAVAFLAYIVIGLQPAEAAEYDVDGVLDIPDIELRSNVTSLSLNKEGKLDTPDTIVGSYGDSHRTLLIGHSTTVFQDLDEVELNDEVYYNKEHYRVISRSYLRKSEVDMRKVMTGEARDTIVIMTCAGELLDNNDSTHRLVITAAAE